MTFDELEKKLEEALDSIGSPTSASEKVDEAIEIMDNLREKYAPTVEITQGQANYLNGIIKYVRNEFNEEELPTDGSIKMTDRMIELDDGYLPLRYFNAVLHPETIKIIGDSDDI